MNELSEKEVLRKAAAYCSLAERCCSEVESKLLAWEVRDEHKAKVIEILLKEKYIDERRFCQSFIHDKVRFNKWGRLKIAQALHRKGISSEITREFLGQIDEEEYTRILTSLLIGKKKCTKAKDAYELNGKLIRFALGRGFEMNEIRRCINDTDHVEMD